MAVVSILFTAFLLSGLALAQGPLRIAFDDSGFDYYGKEAGVVQLDFKAGVLSVHLAEAGNPDGVPHTFGEIEELSKEAFNDLYREPDRSRPQIEKRRMQEDERERLHERANIWLDDHGRWLEVTHEASSLSWVADYYQQEFEDLGFTLTAEHPSSNTYVYTVQQDGRSARVVITRRGNDVRVRFTEVRL